MAAAEDALRELDERVRRSARSSTSAGGGAIEAASATTDRLLVLRLEPGRERAARAAPGRRGSSTSTRRAPAISRIRATSGSTSPSSGGQSTALQPSPTYEAVRRRLAAASARRSSSRIPVVSTGSGYSGRCDGRPEAENLQVAPRQASRDARDQRAEGQRLPDVRPAEAPAPRLPDLRHVQGPRGRAAPHRRSVSLGHEPHRGRRDGRRSRPRRRSSRARSRRAPTGSSRSSSAPPSSTRAASSSSPTTQVIGMDEKPADAVRAKPDSSLVARRAAPSPTARRTRSSPPGTPARCSPPASLELRRIPGVLRPAIAVPIPRAQRPVGPARRRRERRLPARAPAPVRDDGRGLRRGDPRRRRARACGSSRSARSRRRGTSSRSRRTSCSPRATSTSGQHRGPRHPRGRRRRRRHRRLHRQRRAQDGRGDDPHAPRRAPRGDHRHARPASSAACSSARRRGGCAAGSIPDTYGGAYLLGLRGPRRDRARQLVADRDRERDPPRRPRRRARRRRPARCTPVRQRPRLYDRRAFQPPRHNEVTWQRRARKSSSGSRKS